MHLRTLHILILKLYVLLWNTCSGIDNLFLKCLDSNVYISSRVLIYSEKLNFLSQPIGFVADNYLRTLRLYTVGSKCLQCK